jgi:hypothetical protein
LSLFLHRAGSAFLERIGEFGREYGEVIAAANGLLRAESRRRRATPASSPRKTSAHATTVRRMTSVEARGCVLTSAPKGS